MIYSLKYLMDYPCLFSLFFSVCLLPESYFESISNWGVGKKREEAETGFFLKLVYLEECSYKRFGLKLEFNLLSFFSVLSDWIIGCWLDFFQNRCSIFLGEAATENKVKPCPASFTGRAWSAMTCAKSVVCGVLVLFL